MIKNVILDVDTGIDDAVAIALAVYNKRLNVRLITTIAGNLGVRAVTKNTLNLLQYINKRRIPVAVGEEKPLERKKDNSIQAHGKRGLGHFQFPPCELKPVKEKAYVKMYKMIMRAKKKTTIIGLGPLTNIAKMLLTYPDVKKKIDQIIISGGLLEDNKRKPYLSFNIMQDPEAARYIMKSGIKILVCPSDLGHTAFLTPEEVEQTRQTNTTGEMLEYIFRSFKDRHVKVGIATHDSCAMICASHPEIFKRQKMYVHIRFLQEQQTGVIDFDKKKKPNMKVAVAINKKKFKKIYFEALSKMP